MENPKLAFYLLAVTLMVLSYAGPVADREFPPRAPVPQPAAE